MLDLGESLKKDSEFDYEIEHPKDPTVKFYCKATGVKEDLKLMKTFAGKTKIKRGVEVKEDPNYYEIGRTKFVNTVVKWEGIEFNKKPLPCTAESKSDLYERYSDTLCQYILDEVKERVAEEVGMDLGN